METPSKTDRLKVSDIKKNHAIKKHLQIASQLNEVAELHIEVANHLENGYHERAFQTAINAFGFLSLVRESQEENLNNMQY
jgi:hypothetical protein